MAMLTAAGIISKHTPYVDFSSPQEKCIQKFGYSSTQSIFSLILIRSRYESLSTSFSNRGLHRLGVQHVPAKRWLCRLHDPISPDDEYRSSRNIAISLFKRYRTAVERGGGDNLKEFISAGVNAYALGCTDEGLRDELDDMKESGVEIEAMQGFGGNTSLKSKIIPEQIDECILWLSIIFITILCTPQPTVVRWSSVPPVSEETLLQWKGFCALIANAYYVRGMAWLPVKTLQLEQMAVTGNAEETSVVASRMRLVFSTLEKMQATNSQFHPSTFCALRCFPSGSESAMASSLVKFTLLI